MTITIPIKQTPPSDHPTTQNETRSPRLPPRRAHPTAPLLTKTSPPHSHHTRRRSRQRQNVHRLRHRSAVTKRGLKAQAVSIEGFVKPSHVLTEEQKAHKGAIDTFDGEAVVGFFRNLRELGPGHELSCPGYDEENKFEPIPDGESVHADTEVVIFEGIYMLANQEPWLQIHAPLIDERWFVEVRPELVRQRVAERRLRKGKASSLEESLRTYDESDGQNTEWIRGNVGDVDLTVVSEEECSVRWPDGREEM